ncbi:DUF1641 domain-containing protein [Shouchella shacheensis]|uniref:DUF1641 domain-containing protein n=1 Tax=Shouchella shacheensis TaxID=1649580 RepID=UPI0007404E17|nr:DUF1641 domain-containing protein [Shouchella shacheensis]
MAKGTSVIHRMELSEEEKQRRDIEQLGETLAEHKEVIEDVFALMKRLQDREVWNTLNALVGQGDQVLETLVKTVDTPEMTRSIKNVLLMFGTLGTLNVQELEPLILKVNTGIARVADYEHQGKEGGGYLTLLRSLKDPEVIEGMNVAVTFLQGLGVNQEDREKTNESTPQKERRQGEKVETTSKRESHSRASERERSPRKWYLIAAGVSLLALPFVLKK